MPQPQTRQELIKLIDDDTVDNSTIDVSLITDFTTVFLGKTVSGIENWDVSSGIKFIGMFMNSILNSDLSSWNMNKAEQIQSMFQRCDFKVMFSLTKWNLNNLKKGIRCFTDSNYSISIDCSINPDAVVDKFAPLYLLSDVLRTQVKDNKLNYVAKDQKFSNMLSLLTENPCTNDIKFKKDSTTIAVPKIYTVKDAVFTVTFEQSMLDLMNSTDFVINFKSEDDDFYYFEFIDGTKPTIDEIKPFIQKIIDLLPNQHRFLTPLFDETSAFIKQADGTIKLVALYPFYLKIER